MGKDTGRGVAGDIDPTAPGAEFWAIAPPSYVGPAPSWNSRNGGVYSTASTLDNLVTLSEKVSPASNFTIYWDGDLLCDCLLYTSTFFKIFLSDYASRFVDGMPERSEQ